MSRYENMGHREELRLRVKVIESEIESHRESIRHCLPLAGEIAEIKSEYVMHLAIKLNERVQEWRGVMRKIEILERELGPM